MDKITERIKELEDKIKFFKNKGEYTSEYGYQSELKGILFCRDEILKMIKIDKLIRMIEYLNVPIESRYYQDKTIKYLKDLRKQIKGDDGK